jgi:nucleoside-diphosphate-sugar epimerase
MAGADGVFHLAGHFRVGSRHRRYVEAVNVEGTRNVLEVMRDQRVGRGVFTSSLAVNSDTGGRMVDESYRFTGRHLSAHDRIRWRAHYEVAVPMILEGLPLVIVMPGAVYGPGAGGDIGSLVTAYVRGHVPAVPTRSAFSWGHVMDVAQGHILAMGRGRPGRTYMICGPPHPLRHVLRTAGRLVGKRRGPFPLPWWLLRPAAAAARAGGILAPPLRRAGDRLRVLAGRTYLGNDARARRELGFTPRPLEEGLPDTVRSMLQGLFEPP